MAAAAPAFRLPGRPEFPSDLRVMLLDAVAEQPGILTQLRALNYTVNTFESASGAAAFFDCDSTIPDVLLAEADLIQQTENGASELLLRLQEHGTQLVLMKACTQPEDVMRGIESGAADFLQKPVSTHRLRNIWQHVVRKRMSTGEVEDKSSGVAPSKAEGSTQVVTSCDGVDNVTHHASASAAIVKGEATPAGSATAAAESAVQQGHSSHGLTTHGSRLLDADADASSSVTEPVRGGRSRTQRLRSDSGKAAGRAVGNRTPRSRRAKAYNKAGTQGGSAASPTGPLLLSDSSFKLPPPIALPTVPWNQTVPDVWSTNPVGLHSLGISGWRQMPAAFMPVATPEAGLHSGSPKRGRSCQGKGNTSPMSFSKPLGDASQLSSDSFGSSTFELDASLLDLGKAGGEVVMGGSSPCFGGSHDSLDSDFTDLMIPNDLDLDLMFGDDLEAPELWADTPLPAGIPSTLSDVPNNTTALAPEVPPIGLSLRKSQSLVNLINHHLAITAGSCKSTDAIYVSTPAEAMQS